MRRASGLLRFAIALTLAPFLACVPLAAQKRSLPSPSSFPDADGGLGSTREHAFSISGAVADALSRGRINGVRVDLQGLAGGILATTFTSGNGNFQFNNVRPGSYELVFDQTGYLDDREHLEVDGPVLGMTVDLKRLASGEGAQGGPTVSVRELSIPQKARDAMSKGMSLLYQKGDYPGSVKQFERAIQAYPGFYEAYAQMGMAYIKMKDPEKSEKTLRKSLELSQEHYPDALFLLAGLLATEKRLAEAEPLASKAVELDPESWHAQSQLAQTLLALKRADEAEKYAQAAAKLAPDNPILSLLLADIHIELRNDPALLEDLNGYLKLAPNGPYAEKVREQREQVQRRLQNSKASPAGASPSSASPAAVQATP
jgi:tetratricopeptide (TPR) repeat protein